MKNTASIDKDDSLENSSLSDELHGTDEISSSVNDAKKLSFGFSFSAADGESGNESEDLGDLPKSLQKQGHMYDPTISDGTHFSFKEENEITESMHIVNDKEAGVSFNDEDSYTS